MVSRNQAIPSLGLLLEYSSVATSRSQFRWLLPPSGAAKIFCMGSTVPYGIRYTRGVLVRADYSFGIARLRSATSSFNSKLQVSRYTVTLELIYLCM